MLRKLLSKNFLMNVVLPAIFFLIITFSFNWFVVTHFTTHIEQNDGRLLAWTMAWNNNTLLEDPGNIFNANIFYPHKNTLTYSEHLLGASFFTLPVHLATGGNPVISFNFMILLSYFLNGLFTFFLVKHLTKSYWAGLLGGIIFGFCSYKVWNFGHLQNLIIFYFPLMILFFYKYLEGKHLKYAVGVGLCLLMQSLTSWYHMIFIYLTFGLLFLYYLKSKQLNLNDIKRYIVINIAVMLFIMPLAIPYFKFNKENGSAYRIGEMVNYSADLGGYLIPSPNTFISNKLLPLLRIEKARWAENFNFIGYITLFLSLLSLGTYKFTRESFSFKLDNTKKVFILIGLVFFILSLGPVVIFGDKITHVPLPYAIIYYVLPPLRFIRTVARYSTVVFLMVAILAGFGLKKLLDKKPNNNFYKYGVVVVVLGLTIFEYFPYSQIFSFADVSKTPVVYERIKNDNEIKAIVELPINIQNLKTTKYIYYAGIHMKGLLNGYSGFEPKDYNFNKHFITDEINDTAVIQLSRLGVTHVLTNPEYTEQIQSPYLEKIEDKENYRLYKINSSFKDRNVYATDFGNQEFSYNSEGIHIEYSGIVKNPAQKATPVSNASPTEIEKEGKITIRTEESLETVKLKFRANDTNDYIKILCNGVVKEFIAIQHLEKSEIFPCEAKELNIIMKSGDFADQAMITNMIIITK